MDKKKIIKEAVGKSVKSPLSVPPLSKAMPTKYPSISQGAFKKLPTSIPLPETPKRVPLPKMPKNIPLPKKRYDNIIKKLKPEVLPRKKIA